MANRKPAIRIIPFLEWPLEGFRTFEQSRFHLTSRLIALLTDGSSQPGLAGLVTGGQAWLVESLLELRPDLTADVHAAVQSGRMIIGPWYVEPDVFLVSGEAIIRNLLAGQKVAARFGHRLNVGVLMESSGATGQLPQVLKGFGLSAAVMKRGVGPEWGEFWWEAPDGTGFPLFQPVSEIVPGALNSTQGDLKRTLRDIRDRASDHSGLDPLLVFGGGIEAALSADDLAFLIEVAKKTSGVRIDVTSLEEALSTAAAAVSDWSVVSGELRVPGWQPIWTGAASSRMWIKKRNAHIQRMLECWAEPFGTWLEELGLDTTGSLSSYNQHAWRTLLDNQNPAAIQGTIVDAATSDIAARFDRAGQIVQEIVDETLSRLSSAIDFGRFPVDGPFLPVVVFNPGSTRRTDLATVDLVLPDEYRVFEIVDDTGAHVAFEGLVPEDSQAIPRQVRVRFIAADIPPFGYRTYAIRPFQYFDDTGYDDAPGYSIDNQWLTVTLDPNDGTFSLFDKRSGRSFSGLNRYADGGDRGDLYTSCAPAKDTVIDIAANTPLQVERIAGPITESLHYLQILRVPERLSETRDARQRLAAQFVPISIDTTIQINRQVPRVDVTVRISSSALDHRLRAHFPTGIGTPRALFGSHFEVVERDIAVPGPDDTVQWAEQPTADFPLQGFVTLMGTETGLTVASPDLSEAGLIANGSSGCELALTLLRSVGWLCRDDLPNRRVNPGPPTAAPGAQAIGDFEYAYSLLPHESDLLSAWQLARASLIPLRPVLAVPGAGQLPLSGSLLEVDNPAFVVSAVKRAEDGNGVIVRGYNLSSDVQAVQLAVGLPCRKVSAARLDESSSTAVQLTQSGEGQIEFQVAGHQIVTLRLES